MPDTKTTKLLVNVVRAATVFGQIATEDVVVDARLSNLMRFDDTRDINGPKQAILNLLSSSVISCELLICRLVVIVPTPCKSILQPWYS